MTNLSQSKCKKCGASISAEMRTESGATCSYCGEEMYFEAKKTVSVNEGTKEPEVITKTVIHEYHTHHSNPEESNLLPPSQRKSKIAAALLAFFLGGIGIHKFYLRRTGAGIAYLLTFVIGWITSFIVIGGVILLILGILVLIDFVKLLIINEHDFNLKYNSKY